MKKKLIDIIFAVILGLSMLAFVGCGGAEFDPTELLDRIEQLERDLEEARELNGLPGLPGQTPHIGGNGNWWIGSTDTGVRAEGQDGNHGQTPQIIGGYWWVGGANTGIPATGPQGSTGPSGTQDIPVLGIDDTFTYVRAGIQLFSIEVDWPFANTFRIHVTNLNMPEISPMHYIRMWGQLTGGGFMVDTLDRNQFATGLLLGGTANTSTFSFDGIYVWLGWPTTGNAMIPYVIFRVR
ncbi:MAG: hypothetical protein FWC80_05400 [Firmicutes bacterium]|nr:hypothetical protein [Bacillota bacterium]